MKKTYKISLITLLGCTLLIFCALSQFSHAGFLDDCVTEDCVRAHVDSNFNTYIGQDVATGDQGGSQNTFIGYNAAKNYTGLCDNRGSGYCNGSTFIGYEAGYESHNNKATFIGFKAGHNAKSQAVGNTFIGAHAGQNGDSGPYSTFVGQLAGNAASRSSMYNTYLGAESGRYHINGMHNIAIGVNALAGDELTADYTGAGNIHIGGYTAVSEKDLTSTIAIGTNALATADYQMVVGSNYDDIIWKCGIQTSPTDYCYGYDNGTNCFICLPDQDGSCIEGTSDTEIWGGKTVNYDITSCKQYGPVKESYWGSGVVDNNPYDFSFNATGGEGQDAAGANLIIAGGKSTGQANGGSIIFKTSPAGSTSNSIQNDPETRLTINSSGLINVAGTLMIDKTVSSGTTTQRILKVTGTADGTFSGPSIIGINAIAKLNPGASSNSLGFSMQAQHETDQNIYSLTGGSGAVQYRSDYATTIDDSTALKISHSKSQNSSGQTTVTNGYGLLSEVGDEASAGSLTFGSFSHIKLLNPDAAITVTNNLAGLWIDKQTEGSTNSGIVLNGDGAGADIVFGDGQNARIYAADDLGVKRLYAEDESGNQTILSPHDPKSGEWIFYSKNTKTGRTVRVNMEELVKDMEKLTGKKYLIESFVKDK